MKRRRRKLKLSKLLRNSEKLASAGMTHCSKMAARYQATYSSTPANVIYAQSWPIPSHSSSLKYPGKTTSNNRRKSLNSPWICKAKKYATPQQVTIPTGKLHSWASSMLNNRYPEWFEEDSHVKLDMEKEFKLTLQMFKKLTQQVKEVDEQLTSCKRPYSFKHYFTTKDSPGIYQSPLVTAGKNYYPEVPMTNQAYQPCNNFGVKRDQQRPHTHLGCFRKNKSVNDLQKSKIHTQSSVPVFNKTKPNISEQDKSVSVQKLQQTLEQYLKLGNNTESTWSSCTDINDEQENFGYIDPVPVNWDKLKLEELEQEFCSDEKNKTDTFIVRYLELRRLEAETLESEKCSTKIEDNVESHPGMNIEGLRTMNTCNGTTQGVNSTKRCLSKAGEQKTKSETLSDKNLMSTGKSLRKSTTSSSSLSGSIIRPSMELNKYSKSCVVTNGKGKVEKKRENQKHLEKGNAASSSQKKTKGSFTKSSRKVCSAKEKTTSSTNLCQSCDEGQYDIIELALSFDPPCKERMQTQSRPVTAKSAKSKGILPGKSWSSQRRYSLTSDHTGEQKTFGDKLPTEKPRTKSRKKSAKKSTKHIKQVIVS